MSDSEDSEVVSWYLRAVNYRKFGELFAAEDYLLRALKSDPTMAQAWIMLGLVYEDMNRFDDARESFKKASKQTPNWDEPYKHLGLLEYSLGFLEESIEALTKYMKVGGKDIAVLTSLVRVAFNMNDCAKVLELTSAITDIDDDIAEVWEMRGICQARLGRYNAACVSLNMALDIDSESLRAINTVGDLCYEAQNYIRAADFYEMSYAFDDGQPRILFRYGTSLWLLDRWSEALPLLEKYTSLVPNDPKGWNNLGVVLREKGDINKSTECYKRALQIDPSLDVVKKNLETTKNMQVLT
jgi:tetratricopeptide (TPR) repeat protein